MAVDSIHDQGIQLLLLVPSFAREVGLGQGLPVIQHIPHFSSTMQGCGSGSALLLKATVDPDPDPHKSERLDPDPDPHKSENGSGSAIKSKFKRFRGSK